MEQEILNNENLNEIVNRTVDSVQAVALRFNLFWIIVSGLVLAGVVIFWIVSIHYARIAIRTKEKNLLWEYKTRKPFIDTTTSGHIYSLVSVGLLIIFFIIMLDSAVSYNLWQTAPEFQALNSLLK